MTAYPHLADLAAEVGREIGTSDWITVGQDRIDLFARATGDHQWIHVDRDRAAAGPFGATIAHGFLTLSLLPENGDRGRGQAGLRRRVGVAALRRDDSIRGRTT